MIERAHAGLFSLLGLAAHVHRACGIVADQHDCQSGLQRVPGTQAPHLGGDARAQVRRDRLAVDDPCGHDGHVYRAPESFSSAAASPAASPTIFTRLMRAVAPPTISTR